MPRVVISPESKAKPAQSVRESDVSLEDVEQDLQVRSKAWLTKNGKRVFGLGLARLLEEINRAKSLKEASSKLGMSYKHAWKLLRSAQQNLGTSLISSQTGGPDGGWTILTTEGSTFLRVFRQLNRDVARYADRRFRKLLLKKTRKNVGAGI